MGMQAAGQVRPSVRDIETPTGTEATSFPLSILGDHYRGNPMGPVQDRKNQLVGFQHRPCETLSNLPPSCRAHVNGSMAGKSDW